MSTTLDELAPALQSLFGEQADRLARDCKFVQKARVFTGSTFLQTCLLTWLEHPDATLEQFAATAASLGLSVTPQAIDQRLCRAADFFRLALQPALALAVRPAPRDLPLLDRFEAVFLDDCSTISLPAELAGLFKGNGGSTPDSGQSAVKVLLRWEVLSARVEALQLHPGRSADSNLAQGLPAPPKGSLRLFDLGFFKIQALRDCDRAGAYFVCKLKQPAALRASGRPIGCLSRWLEGQGRGRVDRDVEVGQGRKGRVSCRLVAWRLGEGQAAKRREKLLKDGRDKGYEVSAEGLALCSWVVLLSNVPRSVLSAKQVLGLYRARWQIELVFKSWKSELKVDEWRSEKPGRILSEVYGKLLLALAQSWLTLSVWSEGPAKSLRRLLKGMAGVIGKALWRLWTAGPGALLEALGRALPGLRRLGRLPSRRKNLSTFQSLQALADQPHDEHDPPPANLAAATSS